MSKAKQIGARSFVMKVKKGKSLRTYRQPYDAKLAGFCDDLRGFDGRRQPEKGDEIMEKLLVPGNTPFPLTDALPSQYNIAKALHLDMPIAVLDFSTRTQNALNRESWLRIRTVEDLMEAVARETVWAIRGIGVKAHQEIVEKIEAYIG